MKVALYGVGKQIEEALKLVGRENVYMIVDSYRSGDILGYEIKPPDIKLLKQMDRIIIAAPSFRFEIFNFLREKGLNNVFCILNHQIEDMREYCTRKYMQYMNSTLEFKEKMSNTYCVDAVQIADNAKIFINREYSLADFPKRLICAEIGVAYGNFSEKILQIMEPKKFYAIDYFSQKKWYLGCGFHEMRGLGDSHEEIYRNRFKKYIENGILEVKQGLSWEVLKTFPDDYFDFVYLDADHAYESVKKDLAVLYDKVKSNGIIQANDFTDLMPGLAWTFGVVPAIFEFLQEGKGEVAGYCIEKYGKKDASSADLLIRVIKEERK